MQQITAAQTLSDGNQWSLRLFPRLCAPLPLESETAQRGTDSRELQSRFPLALGVVHCGIREPWVVVEMKDTKLSMEWQ